MDSQIPTEIFLWPERYPGGAVVAAKATVGNVTVDYDSKGSSMRVYPAGGLEKDARVTISIRAANAPAPSPPGFPCRYMVPFDFRGDVDAHTQLPDGDTIIL